MLNFKLYYHCIVVYLNNVIRTSRFGTSIWHEVEHTLAMLECHQEPEIMSGLFIHTMSMQTIAVHDAYKLTSNSCFSKSSASFLIFSISVTILMSHFIIGYDRKNKNNNLSCSINNNTFAQF